MKRLFTHCILVLTLLLASCTGLSDMKQPNDNAIFYNTEWSTNDNTEGLKFFSDDTVMYFAKNETKTGTFKYYPPDESIDVGLISFDGLTLTGNPPAEITTAGLETTTSLKVIWHKLGESKNYYMMMYKRR